MKHSHLTPVTPEEIDDLLPQTQCGLCGYGGCLPYAEAMVFEQAPLNLCPPGGVKTLNALGELLNQDVTPFVADMAKNEKPVLLAIIREDECIGCTKCIKACPVDAIIGTSKQMHTVIASECTGCELCVAPCPVDCIDIVEITSATSDAINHAKASLARQRFQARESRLARDKAARKQARQTQTNIQKQNYIQAALERVKHKKQK